MFLKIGEFLQHKRFLIVYNRKSQAFPDILIYLEMNRRKIIPAVLAAVLTIFSNNAGSSTYFDELQAYIEKLGNLREHWREAAQISYGGEIERAQQLLQKTSSLLSNNNKWIKATQLNKEKMYRLYGKQKPRNLAEFFSLCLFLESPEMGINYIETTQKQEGDLDFGEAIHFSQCLIETGRYERASRILCGLIKEDTASNWKEIIRSRVEAIENIKNGKPSTEFYRAIFLKSGLRWYNGRLGPILWFWHCGQDLQHLQILVSLFKNAQDKYGEELVLKSIAEGNAEGIKSKDSANAILTLANKAYEGENYEEAFRLWQQVERDYEDTPAWGKAVFNTGIALKEQNKFDEAIKVFEKILTGYVNDTEPGSHIMEAYRNYRPRAQWAIGDCLFAKSDYAGALDAYRLTEKKYPFRTWCGTCQAEYEYKYALYQGLCLEYLERYDQAVKNYYHALAKPLSANPTAHIHIVDLYQSTEQVSDLQNILDEMDIYFEKKILREHGKKLYEDPDFDKHFTTRVIRQILEIRELGRRKDINRLMQFIIKEGADAYPEQYHSRLSHWKAIEAAKALAQYPDEAVIVLKSKMKGNLENKVIYYTLALCGTAEAIEILKSEAIKQKNINWITPLVYALSLTGDIGKTTLGELAKTADGNLKIALRLYKEGELGDVDKEIRFPEIPKKIKLPARLAEIDEDVAYEQSLPKAVDVDLSTPASAIDTFFTSLLIADNQAYLRCTTLEQSKWLGEYEDLVREFQNERLRYDLSEEKYVSGDTAQVKVNFKKGSKSGQLIFVLRKRGNNWLVADIEEVRRQNK